jgi:hypothetical protein
MKIKYYLEWVYFTLISLTVFAFILGKISSISNFMIIILLLSTLIKGYLIIDYFMGLKDVRAKYRFIPIVWLVLVLGGIGFSFFRINLF